MPSLSAGALRIKIKPAGGRWRVILPLLADCWFEVAQIGHETYNDALECAKAWLLVFQAKYTKGAKT